MDESRVCRYCGTKSLGKCCDVCDADLDLMYADDPVLNFYEMQAAAEKQAEAKLAYARGRKYYRMAVICLRDYYLAEMLADKWGVE